MASASVGGRLPLTFTFIALALLGCRRSPDGPAAREPATLPAASVAKQAPAARRNACALVDRDEVARLVGQPVAMLHDVEDESQTTCEISYASGPVVVIYVEVHWAGGRDLARAEKAGYQLAVKAMRSAGGADIARLTGAEGVKAEDAFYSDVMPSWVLKGDVLIKIISPRFDHDLTSKVFYTLAPAALARLPS